jgi:hypothetical protein
MERPAMARELRSLMTRIGGFDVWEDFGEEFFAEFVKVALRERRIAENAGTGKKNFGSAVAERHGNKHGLGFVLGDEIVKDHVVASERRSRRWRHR